MSENKIIRLEKIERTNGMQTDLMQNRLRPLLLNELTNYIKYAHSKDENGNPVMIAYIDIVVE